MLADRERWNRAARAYDGVSARAAERRWGAFKADLFAHMDGSVLFLAAGTGLDFQFFPSGKTIIAVDISEGMLARAVPRAEAYDGSIQLSQMDVSRLAFRDGCFDQIVTSCTFCSVSDPLAGLRELFRVLRPGGRLLMFEHTGSRWFPFSAMLHACTALSRRLGPAMNRRTVNTVRCAGFEVAGVERHFLDVLKSVDARKPAGTE